MKSCLSAADNSLEILKSGNTFAFEEDKNKFRDKLKDTMLNRKRANELKKDMKKSARLSRTMNDKLEKDKRVTLANILENVNRHKGPFEQKFDQFQILSN